VHGGPLAELSTERIIQYMVGREVARIFEREPVAPGSELLRVEGLSRRPLLEGIGFTLRAGEIVGLAGLVGAGRTELCRALFGIDAVDAGRVWVQGRQVRIRHPRDAVAAGLALIPEDRQRAGLAPGLPLSFNLTSANLRALSAWGFIRRARERQATADYIGKLRIRADSPGQLAVRLSGGNQQKLVIAKWLFRRARVFLFDEPTRGIDVGAKVEVFQLMDELARSGAAILMVSSELPELLQVADRLLVMRRGRIAAELPRGAAPEEIMRRATLEAPSEENTP
jgi:ABC-type sugar transport system ATPase subunit